MRNLIEDLPAAKLLLKFLADCDNSEIIDELDFYGTYLNLINAFDHLEKHNIVLKPVNFALPNIDQITCLYTLRLLDHAVLDSRDGDPTDRVLEIRSVLDRFHGKEQRTTTAKRNAEKSHIEDRESQEQAILFYEENKHQFKTRVAVAREISKTIVPYKVRTIDGWLKKHIDEKKLLSNKK